MNILRPATIALLAAIGVGCGQTGTAQQPAASTTTTVGLSAPVPINIIAPTTTTVAPTTSTTVCVAADTTALRVYRDELQGSIRQVEGAVAQIQLVIDNGTRDRAGALRHQTTVQADYDEAKAAANILGTDTAKDKVAYQEGRLADAKDLVASWDAIIAKARGDLTRARAQKADYEQKVRETTAQIAAASSC